MNNSTLHNVIKIKHMKQIQNSSLLILGAFLLAISSTSCATSSMASSKSTDDNQTIVTGNYQSIAERNYAAIMAQQQNVVSRIDMLTTELNSATRSRTKRIVKEITSLNNELAILERQAMAYPESVRNQSTSENPELEAQQKEAFMNELDRKADQIISNQSDDDQSWGSSDPELDRAYKNYSNPGSSDYDSESSTMDRVVYSVQIGSGGNGKSSSFRGVSGVKETRLSNGSSAYTVGAYSSLNAAKQECARIKSSTSYRDAFVVAFIDGRKTSVKEALSVQGK